MMIKDEAIDEDGLGRSLSGKRPAGPGQTYACGACSDYHNLSALAFRLIVQDMR